MTRKGGGTSVSQTAVSKTWKGNPGSLQKSRTLLKTTFSVRGVIWSPSPPAILRAELLVVSG